MSKGPSSKSDLIVDQRQLLAGIREYFQTPAEMRGNVQSMKSLAEHLGCGVQDLHRAMSLNPEMGSDILQGVALAGAVQIPRVLYNLMEAIEAGIIKAPDIYLDSIRQTTQDERLMQMSTPASEDLTPRWGMQLLTRICYYPRHINPLPTKVRSRLNSVPPSFSISLKGPALVVAFGF
jgi:hypothetical protein